MKVELETAFIIFFSGEIGTSLGVTYFFLKVFLPRYAYMCERKRIKRKKIKMPNSVQKLLAQRPGERLAGGRQGSDFAQFKSHLNCVVSES